MKYRFTQKLFGYFFHNSCMKQAKAQHLILDSKAIKNEYKAVLERADDIGKSHLMSSYCMGAYFIGLLFHRRNVSACTKTGCTTINFFIWLLEMQTAISMKKSFREGRNGLRNLI